MGVSNFDLKSIEAKKKYYFKFSLELNIITTSNSKKIFLFN